MPTNNYVNRKEKDVERALYRLFNREYKVLIELLKEQDTKKWFFNNVQVLLGRLRNWTVDILKERVQTTVKKWADINARKYNPWFTVDFDVVNSDARKYIDQLEQLHLSKAQWSIYKTTEEQIMLIANQAIEQWTSYTKVAEEIQETQPFVFSRARAELIGITEIGRAYEFGNWLPMKDIERQGGTVMKRWITAWDDKVRASHRANWLDWWIALDQNFSWTWDLYAPAKKVEPFRCRCATIYQVE